MSNMETLADLVAIELTEERSAAALLKLCVQSKWNLKLDESCKYNKSKGMNQTHNGWDHE